ncbi:unnamed protein product [Mytilus edulis]|uniref:HTH CENPB-type domain-containing protein n=1 Tax=Mytilus edulis TaxID=6550 RepID=A0A8S3TBA9_MYTED|nr:unnamed protein product [Mytilus edulis]
MSKLKASKLYNIPRTTLLRRLKTMDLASPATKPTVLAIKDEEALVGHILRMEERGFGLTITDVRKLAYEIAVRSGRKHCFNNDKKSAGYDWWQGFRDRHPCLSVRIPEGLSSMLNPNVISAYFKKLGSFMNKLKIKDKPQQIFNADETGVSTVHDPSKVVGKRGKKSVHSKTSGERGENVTALCWTKSKPSIEKMNLVNIFSGFRATGIFPFKPNAIPIEAYGPSKTSVLNVEVEASIENGHDVSKDQNQSRLTTTANEEQSVSAVNPQVPSTSSEKTYLREILRTPEVVKQRTEKKTRRVTEARCLTEREFLNELKQKRREKQSS